MRVFCWLMLLWSAALASSAAATDAPTPVGMATIHVADSTRADPIHADRVREWLVDVYYPAADARSGRAQHYAPDDALVARLIADGYYDVSEAVLRSWTTRTGPARIGATPAAGKPLPLVTLSPGSGVAAFNYARLATAIAQRGYVVAVIDHPYIGTSRLPDGHIRSNAEDPVQHVDDPKAWAPRVREWARDVSVTIDRLAGTADLPPGLSIDASRIVATGQSLGGTVAVELCSRDPRVDACADFEGAVEGTTAYAEGPRKPTLFTGSRSAKPGRPHVAPDLEKAPWHFLALGEGASNWGVAISGGSHMSFSDAPFEMPETLSRFGGTLMTPERSFEVYAGLVDALSRAYASGGGDAVMEAFLATVPEAKATRSRSG